MNNESTFSKTVHGSKWIAFGSIVNKILGIASFLLLARLLDPTSYGLIAIALMIVGVFNRMLVTGFESAVIQKQENTDQYLSAVWSFNILKSLFVFTVIYFAGPAIANFFHAEAAVEVIRWSGLFVIIPALTNPKQLYLFKQFKFNKVFYRDVSGQVGYIVVGALYAIFIAADVWALFYANIARYLISMLIIYVYYPVIPAFTVKFSVLRDLIPYSKWITAQNFVNYFLSIVDNAIIGRLMSPEILGLYSKARNLSATAMTLVSNMLKDLSFVAFSKVQDEKEKIRKGFVMGVDVILFLGLSNIFIIWFGAGPLVDIFLGQQWIDIVPALKIFTLFSLSNAILSLSYTLFLGAGKPSVSFKIKLVGLILYAVFAYVGIQYKSMVGAALGVTASNAIIMMYALYKMQKIYQISIIELFKRSLSTIIPMGIISVFAIPLLTLQLQWNSFITAGVLGVYYAGFLLLFLLFGRLFKEGGFHTMLKVFNTLKPKKML